MSMIWGFQYCKIVQKIVIKDGKSEEKILKIDAKKFH